MVTQTVEHPTAAAVLGERRRIREAWEQVRQPDGSFDLLALARFESMLGGSEGQQK